MIKDLEKLREWLISKGIDPEELDEFVESPIIRDIGEGLKLSLMNDEFLAIDMVGLLMRVDELEQRIQTLEGGA